MMTNQMRPIHPGEILREEFITPLGITGNALAIALRVPATRVGDILNEKRGITSDTALRLARFFNTTPQFWLNLQSSFDLKKTELTCGEKIKKEIFPIEAAA